MLSFRGRPSRSEADGETMPGRTPAHDVAPQSAPSLTPGALFARDLLKRRAMVSARVVADGVRCVECGICSYNCPLGIDVRGHVREGVPISDHACLTCGECVARCPRGTLRFEESSVFTALLAGEVA